jgi:RNA-directed DNA polymerase
MIRGWLKAGVFEPGKGFAPTYEGTPQGGVISPLLMNIALHGMEEAAGVRYEQYDPTRVRRTSPACIRYADDFLVFCQTRQQAEEAQSRLAAWLAPRGLSFNEDKTHIAHLDEEGVDFLGFNLRRHSGKLLIKPGKAAVKRVKRRLAAEMRALRGANAAAVVATVNPIIRGWANYYRGAVSSRVFATLDDYMWRRNYKWARHVHPNKPRRWITRRYFGRLNKDRSDRWVFGNPDTGAYMVKFAWTNIVRHVPVKGGASPDDPAQAQYWAARRRKSKPPVTPGTQAMLRRQHGRCPLCGDLLLYAGREPHSPEEWEQWDRTTRKAITRQKIAVCGQGGVPGSTTTTRLVHSDCQRRATGAKDPALLYA